MALRYPSMPAGGVDAGSIIDMFNSGYDRSKARADERKAVDAFGGYLDSIYSNQGSPQSLSALGSMMQPQQGAVQRTPLPAATDPATARVEQAFAAQGQGSAPDNLNSNDIAARFLKTVRDGGVTNPYALAAIASTGKRESGFDPKNAVRTWSDPSQSGQAGTAGGIMSWRNERLQALQRFAQQNGDDPRAPSPETQAKYLLTEDPTLIQKLQSAGSAEEAQQLMNNAWRYAGYDQQGGETAQRMALASQYAQQFGGSPSQQALEGMAVGQSMPMGQGVQMADASGQMMPQGGSLPPMPDRDAMLKLFANPITRPLAVQAAQSRIEAVQNQNDPMAQVKYQTAVANLQKLQREATGDSKRYGLNPIYGQDEQGNTVLGVLGDDGSFKSVDTGGVNISTGVDRIDLGTNWGLLDKRSGQVVGTLPKENYQEAFDTQAGTQDAKSSAEARSNLPKVEDNANAILGMIESLSTDPYLDSMVGPVAGRLPNVSGDAARVKSKMDQIGGQAFLQAFETLRGGGQISNVEGERATAALARLNTAQSPDDYRQALKELSTIVRTSLDRARRSAGAGTGAKQPPGASGEGWQDMGGVRIRRKQ